MEKIDLKKELKDFYNPSSKEISEVVVPKMNFLMIDGMGSPESDEFKSSIEALFPIAYTAKFAIKKERGIDFAVMPLEGLWWADDYKDFDPEVGDRNQWKWTLMIMQPDFVSKDDLENAKEAVAKKKPSSYVSNVRFEVFEEGRSAQIMHIGPFANEGPNVMKIHEYIASTGGKLEGSDKKHHEIYLSDFRRVNPEKMKTILRQPFK